MKTILFLDDWMLDSRQDVVRRFVRPELSQREFGFEDRSLSPAGGYVNVARDPETGLYKMWYTVAGRKMLSLQRVRED